MEMHQVRYFLSLCAELNFTRAAERCNVAQPSLTRAIKQLEEELGGALFHRERANTHLSELGHRRIAYVGGPPQSCSAFDVRAVLTGRYRVLSRTAAPAGRS